MDFYHPESESESPVTHVGHAAGARNKCCLVKLLGLGVFVTAAKAGHSDDDRNICDFLRHCLLVLFTTYDHILSLLLIPFSKAFFKHA